MSDILPHITRKALHSQRYRDCDYWAQDLFISIQLSWVAKYTYHKLFWVRPKQQKAESNWTGLMQLCNKLIPIASISDYNGSSTYLTNYHN